MSNIYTAITIGPIIKTILQSKRTREAWQASYFFSYLMEKLMEKANEKGSIILPATKNADNYFGAGIFPDRLIMKSEYSIDVKTKIINPALQNIKAELRIDYDLLKKYLNIHYVQVEELELKDLVLKNEKGEAMNSFIHKLNYLLNVQELNSNYNNSETEFFKEFFGDKVRKNLYGIAFKDKKHRFNSILEITAQSNSNVQNKIQEFLKENQDDDIEEKLFVDPEVEQKMEKYQKYIAILRADGDNFGALISKISKDEKLVRQFSKDLVSFSEKATETILQYGGTIIYTGGDDILAFCPVKNNDKNIFQLVKELNEAFHDKFSGDNYKDHNLSLSYGLSISYYKYPLNEALDLSFKLLFDKAKQTPTKNCIAFQVLQHSGSLKETILNFDHNYKSFLTMLVDIKEKDQLLQSLTYQLVNDQERLKLCLTQRRIDEYFENHYNPEDKRQEVKDFIAAMRNNLKANYIILEEINKKLKNDNKPELEDIENLALVQMNAIAKTINFLK